MHVAGYALPLRLLPLVMGISMVIQQKMTPSTMDKAQQQIMMIMPVMFTFMFWGFPSGLVLYWLVNNVITIGQQWWMNRSFKAAT
jgi:YidC/Oxa1 family membrane protein insertase